MDGLLGAAERLYRAMLLAYPARFRHTWGRQMAETFRDGSRDTARRGSGALARFWLRTAGDLLRSAAAERWAARRGGGAMSGRSAGFAMAAGLGALGFGWMCLHTDETGILAGSLMLLAFALSCIRPRAAWFAALLGLVAPLAQALAHVAGWAVPYQNDWPAVAAAAIAVIFSVAATVAGVVCNRTLTWLRHAAS